MPKKVKMKTKSSVKKRFKVTSSGLVRSSQSGKRHGMIKRTNKQIRSLRRTTILSAQDSKILKNFLPYDR